MGSTPRLYWNDPLLLRFESTVVGHERGGRVVLAETAFYPESGGQLADRGTMAWEDGRARVVDASADGEDRVLHHLDGAAPPVGAAVEVTIDEARRRLHMSLHTAQHMLSRALLDLAGAETRSSRLGDRICTIDLSVERLSDEVLAAALELVNRVVAEDRPVRARYPTAAELAEMPLRRDPKVAESVRVIDVDGFDMSPCGGTHVVRTGQVGLVHVVGVERKKGGLRVSFHAGERARADYVAKDAVARALSRELSCDVERLPDVLAKQLASLSSERRETRALRERLAGYLASELAAGAQVMGSGELRLVPAVLDEPVEVLRSLAQRLCEEPHTLAVLAAALPGEGGTHLLIQRGEAVPTHCGQLLRALATRVGGKGGGRPERAEGRLPTGADVLGALRGALPGFTPTPIDEETPS